MSDFVQSEFRSNGGVVGETSTQIIQPGRILVIRR